MLPIRRKPANEQAAEQLHSAKSEMSAHQQPTRQRNCQRHAQHGSGNHFGKADVPFRQPVMQQVQHLYKQQQRVSVLWCQHRGNQSALVVSKLLRQRKFQYFRMEYMQPMRTVSGWASTATFAGNARSRVRQQSGRPRAGRQVKFPLPSNSTAPLRSNRAT